MRDPQNWRADDYMDEINAVANRGYTLAFHEGRLTNLAHDYESTGSTSFYEYAGRVVKWEGDDLIFEAKNRLVAGDVLEFLSPLQREPILIRMYEFNFVKDNKVADVVNAGIKPLIRVPAALFHLIDKEKLKELLPEFSLIRKEKMLENSEKLKKDKDFFLLLEIHQWDMHCQRQSEHL
jgi:putative protease